VKKQIVDPGRPQMVLWQVWISCIILKATNPHTEYVILIAFSLQRWLRKRASLLRYAYLACLFHIIFTSFFFPFRGATKKVFLNCGSVGLFSLVHDVLDEASCYLPEVYRPATRTVFVKTKHIFH
jgi:hypothetical protein